VFRAPHLTILPQTGQNPSCEKQLLQAFSNSKQFEHGESSRLLRSASNLVDFVSVNLVSSLLYLHIGNLMNHSENLAYLAGIIDGEGSLLLWMNKSSNERGQFNLRVNVTSTDKCLIDWIFNNFGGSIYECNSPSRKSQPNWKKQYVWQINRPEMLEFLKKIYPFLIIKKERCEIAIKFRETFETRKRNLTKEIFQIRLSLYHQMKHLNHRGS
jgi:hypothetical protein